MKDRTNRVVITGLGIVAPNGLGLSAYESALRAGRSGIRYVEKLEELKFGCRVAGVPEGAEAAAQDKFSAEALLAMNSSITYAALAGVECWEDAGLTLPTETGGEVDWDTGAIVGTGIGGLDTVGAVLVPRTDAGKVRRLGSTMVEQVMASGVSARLSRFLALGGQVTTNSSACTTGAEAVVDAYFKIKDGRSKRMIAGGAEGSSHYIWAGFDAMRVLDRGHNDAPERASRPMSASAGGFVPGSGAGLLMLESLDSARDRGARIYAEVLGGQVNCGGQRDGGSMTAPNPTGVQRCVRAALMDANIGPDEVDVINGHLTATMADPQELANWSRALERPPSRFPLINSTKSLIGHGLGAAGGMELVASTLQLSKGFVHPSLNCEDLHPELSDYSDCIPQTTVEKDLQVLAKASFGFGDVNACVLLRRWAD
jgi:3-oxoacyl-(acyl-carrier-protein) synthase